MKLKDPADKANEMTETDQITRDMEALDVSTVFDDPDGLSLKEIGSVPPGMARQPHPFEGYALGRKVKIGAAMIPSTYIVILRDDNVYQDPSGRNVTHDVFAKDENGNDIKGTDVDGRFRPARVSNRKLVNLKTFHARVVGDYDRSMDGPRTEIVFDREVKVSGKPMACAVVPSHAARAQLVYHLNKSGSLEVDRTYLLAEPGQASRLRRVFQNVHYQQLRGELEAQRFDADPAKK